MTVFEPKTCLNRAELQKGPKIVKMANKIILQRIHYQEINREILKFWSRTPMKAIALTGLYCREDWFSSPYQSFNSFLIGHSQSTSKISFYSLGFILFLKYYSDEC